MSRSGIAGSYGNSSFSFLRNGRTVFRTGCSNSHSLQQFKRRGSSLFSTPSPAFATCIRFLMMAALPGVRRYLSVAVVCIFLIISSVEHLFMCLVAICMSSLEKLESPFGCYLLIIQMISILSFRIWAKIWVSDLFSRVSCLHQVTKILELQLLLLL